VFCRGLIFPRTLGHEIVGETRLENLEQWFTEKSVIYLVVVVVIFSIYCVLNFCDKVVSNFVSYNTNQQYYLLYDYVTRNGAINFKK